MASYFFVPYINSNGKSNFWSPFGMVGSAFNYGRIPSKSSEALPWLSMFGCNMELLILVLFTEAIDRCFNKWFWFKHFILSFSQHMDTSSLVYLLSFPNYSSHILPITIFSLYILSLAHVSLRIFIYQLLSHTFLYWYFYTHIIISLIFFPLHSFLT